MDYELEAIKATTVKPFMSPQGSRARSPVKDFIFVHENGNGTYFHAILCFNTKFCNSKKRLQPCFLSLGHRQRISPAALQASHQHCYKHQVLIPNHED